MSIENKLSVNKAVVCIVGLGYVGLPLAIAFAKSLKVIGFDTDKQKLKDLSTGVNNEFSKDELDTITFTSNPNEIRNADFIIIAVPTPVTKSKEPDLKYIKSASEIVSENLKKDSVVILESTVYPGVTEEILKPILEKSGLTCGTDFKIAYSPERINPGDEVHNMRTITKVVSGIDNETTDLVDKLYKKVVLGTFKARDIKTAEAAKVIENVQRDLNIALMNELAIIFNKLGLDTNAVLEAAATKWNFHRYSPGLVGGHCIPVDPYYLVYKAKELGYHPQVILAGRAINDYMPKHIAEMAIKSLNEAGKVIKGSKVVIMGLTYKENVQDTRESPVRKIVKELKEFSVDVFGNDPLLSKEAIEDFGVKTYKFDVKMDAVIITIAHDEFKKLNFADMKKFMTDKPVLIDVRGMFDGEEAKRNGFYYRSL